MPSRRNWFQVVETENHSKHFFGHYFKAIHEFINNDSVVRYRIANAITCWVLGTFDFGHRTFANIAVYSFGILSC